MMLYILNGDIDMEIVIKIQSVSDIITNSSSETYLRTHYGCEDDFKAIIDALAGEGFSDNFEIIDEDDRISIKAKSEEYENIAAILRNVNFLFYASNCG